MKPPGNRCLGTLHRIVDYAIGRPIVMKDGWGEDEAFD